MKRFSIFIVLILLFCFAQSFGQTAAKHDFSLDAKLPMDPEMRTGVLKNGMHYYIRKNAKPEHRAEMRLAVHAGSVLENDSQQGLAHLVEHMAFNGTKNFSKSAVVDYLESIGVRFGADLNAYTSYDETVYMLEVPTDTPKFVTKGLQILEDWAHNVSFDDIEIDKERGVVIEEWRLGRGAFDRMGRKIYPVIYNNSKYADRSPIGKKNIIQFAPHDTLKQFYKDWYRSDLQAIVVVGDFDLDQMEKQVIAQFSGIKPVKDPRPRPEITIPPHKGTVAAVATDKECQYVLLQLEYRNDKMKYATVKDYKDHLTQQLFSYIFSERLQELQHKSNPPFSFANAGISPGVGNTSEFRIFALCGDNDISGSLKTLLQEVQRVNSFGFAPTELERAKKAVLQQIESAYKERNKTDSKSLTDECVRNFLGHEDIMGIANDYEYSEKLIPEISLAEVNRITKIWITNNNNDIVVQAPDKQGVKVPSEAEIQALVAQVKNEKTEAYKDVVSSKGLMDKKPIPGKIVRETTNKITGTTEWILQNGARVILKPTDFKEDEILFGAYSPGGSSLVDDKDFNTCAVAPSIIDECGISEFDANALNKLLAGKNAGVTPYISELFEQFNGNASPKDLETMLQLLNLYFTNPKENKEGFDAYISKVKSFVKNSSLSPEAILRDSNQLITSNFNFRRRPYSEQLLNEIDESKVMKLYKERFSNVSDFTFLFVGNFKPEVIKPMIEMYIGGLPISTVKEKWKNLHIGFPKGIVKRIVKKGTEPKSYVTITMKGNFEWNLKNKIDAEAMIKVLNIMLRETMREDKSGVYGVSANLVPVKYPEPGYTITINFGCAPENVDMLVNTAFEQVEKLKREGATTQNMEKTIETMHRTREINMKDNNFWLGALKNYEMNDDNINDILKYDEMASKITPEDVKKSVSKYFNFDNYVEVVLMPENR